ncbi:hypothetical protein N7539_005640 [Penicillium diatomitis]|uniref:Phosphoglycolate phosphatase n=1 Tax=Penicillium diatomitis TaxID=2819901 RepID=A0A9W9X7C0_9EURO|nr:uncharacterized protein N7539_005640 [Penicillium diatomitis]KAJ5485652.1 hypothetical protein N7539_005640 [Penicillium diatomitis]
MISLAIFDFDGTLFDTHDSISHTIQLTFQALLPSQPPSPTEIQRLIASGAGLSDTFKALHPTPSTLTTSIEAHWIAKYRELYAIHGQSLIQAFPGAEIVLSELRTADIPVAIVTNKGVEAVKTALERNGLRHLVPEDWIVGDNTPGAKRKPDPASFKNVLKPMLVKAGKLEAGDVLVVGDTVADIEFARNIGGSICWCRYGYGDRAVCEAMRPGFIVDALADVLSVIRG